MQRSRWGGQGAPPGAGLDAGSLLVRVPGVPWLLPCTPLGRSRRLLNALPLKGPAHVPPRNPASPAPSSSGPARPSGPPPCPPAQLGRGSAHARVCAMSLRSWAAQRDRQSPWHSTHSRVCPMSLRSWAARSPLCMPRSSWRTCCLARAWTLPSSPTAASPSSCPPARPRWVGRGGASQGLGANACAGRFPCA